MPGVYTNVHTFVKWIQAEIDADKISIWEQYDFVQSETIYKTTKVLSNVFIFIYRIK